MFNSSKPALAEIVSESISKYRTHLSNAKKKLFEFGDEYLTMHGESALAAFISLHALPSFLRAVKDYEASKEIYSPAESRNVNYAKFFGFVMGTSMGGGVVLGGYWAAVESIHISVLAFPLATNAASGIYELARHYNFRLVIDSVSKINEVATSLKKRLAERSSSDLGDIVKGK